MIIKVSSYLIYNKIGLVSTEKQTNSFLHRLESTHYSVVFRNYPFVIDMTM